MKRARLPLTALRCFEAAARQASFTRAAEELFITQAAVSRQVRDLELLLGRRLFERRHRAVELTDAGLRLMETTTAAFDAITATLEEVAATARVPTVRLSVEPSFAGTVLVNRLAGFTDAHPETDIIIDSEARLVDFRDDSVDLAVRHDTERSAWPGTESRLLYRVDMIVVASPSLLTQKMPERPGDLAGLTLLHEYNRDLWRDWFAAADAPPPAQRGPVFADGGLVLQAALRGQGVALMDERAVVEELRDGRLTQLLDLALPHGAYWLVTRRFDRLKPAALAFADWLMSAVRTTTDSG